MTAVNVALVPVVLLGLPAIQVAELGYLAVLLAASIATARRRIALRMYCMLATSRKRA